VYELSAVTKPVGMHLHVTSGISLQVQNTLASLLPEEAIHCSHRATGYTVVPEEEGGGVVVHFRGQQDVRARFVVAADGVRSALRATMVPQDPGPR
jgi:2-polyprenyl-6-methoxyphenol hydroxylase-like FAD-dependent oxidoreductase